MDAFLGSVPEWTDESRCLALFSSLPPSMDHNQRAWTDKMEFWRNMIMEASRRGLLSKHRLLLTATTETTNSANEDVVSVLGSRFKRNGLKPKCLRRVVLEWINQGQLVPYDQFQQPTSGHSRFLKFAIDGFMGTLKFAGLSLFEPSNDDEQQVPSPLILMPLVEQIEQRVLRNQSEQLYNTDCILSFAEWSSLLDDQLPEEKLSDMDKQILLRKLELDGHVVTEKHQHQTLLKFKRTSNDRSKLSINEADRGVFVVKNTVQAIETQIADLERRADETTQRIKSYLAKNQKSMALAHLKSRKGIESLVQKRIGSLTTLHTILLQIQQSESESDILNAFKTGSTTLSTLIQEHDLNVERVDEVMDSLQEVMADQQEIDTAMQQGQDAILETQGLGDADIEQELAQLSLNEIETELDKLLEQAPQVPAHQLPTKPAKSETASVSTSKPAPLLAE